MSMLLPMIADLYFGYADWIVFFVCMIITAFFGGCLLLANSGAKFDISLRQAFIMTNSTMLGLCLFGALPFWFSSLGMSFTDSFFESTSGITTTGATVIIGLDYAPAGILLWRAMLQWIGGISLIIMAISILPFLKVGGMQLFKSQISKDEKAIPRSAQQIKMIALVYLLLSGLCTIGYMIAGMEVFDAIAHAMATISTGGFSTFDESFLHYSSNFGIECVAMIFMILGALPFMLYLRFIRGDYKALQYDTQVQLFLTIVATVIVIIASYLFFMRDMSLIESLRQSAFNVIAVITGTAFSIGDYSHWGTFPVICLFFLMSIGGCAGSTTSGIKIFRFQVLYTVTNIQIRKLIYPSALLIPHYNKRPIPKDVPISVMGFFFVYSLSFTLFAICLSFTGLDFMTSISSAISIISNTGFGMGGILSATDTYQSMSDYAKWMLSFGMLLGRLEIFIVLVLLSRYLWKH
jgi:trk system potassium uptake protein